MAPKPVVVWKAARQLGLNRLALFAAYRLGLASGYYRWRTPVAGAGEKIQHRDERGSARGSGANLLFEERWICVPEGERLAAVVGSQVDRVVQEAEEIVGGWGRVFGEPVPLTSGPTDLDEIPPLPDHWTAFEGKDHPRLAGPRQAKAPQAEARQAGTDIRLVWEAGRLGWIYPLARAYRLTGDEPYADAFWRHVQAFLAANPANRGPHWASGQEVAIRLVGLAFGGRVFGRSTAATPALNSWLARSIAQHACRIPPTLVYARAQDNNHLVTEALGLYTAGLLLAGQPEASRWLIQGWRWLNHAFQHQIRPDGTYVQHSTNYHRLVLQAALWAWMLARPGGDEWPAFTLERLRLATAWLLARLDPVSGRVPNLGANDGAYLFPFDSGGFQDYRPVLQACGRAFLGVDLFPPGPWDEMSLWFGLEPTGFRPEDHPDSPVQTADLSRLDCPPTQSWASLRAVHYRERPSHSDPLHVELWWRGHNLARDAGTFCYNADPPWDNALAQACVHNTIQIDGQDPMQRAGRFLWLDWAQARLLGRTVSSLQFPPLRADVPSTRVTDRGPMDWQLATGNWELEEERLVAEHTGYARLGVIHERSLVRHGLHEWQVLDRLQPASPPGTGTSPADQPHRAELIWLLPDWPWDLEGCSLRLKSPFGWVRVEVQAGAGSTPGEGEAFALALRLIRAGEALVESDPWPAQPQVAIRSDAIRGWYSPIYGQKQPALTCCAALESPLPFWFTTHWTIPV